MFYNLCRILITNIEFNYIKSLKIYNDEMYLICSFIIDIISLKLKLYQLKYFFNLKTT